MTDARPIGDLATHPPLGSTYDGAGTHFAVWAPDADAVWVCLFDDHRFETRRSLAERTLGVWHGYVAGVRPGQHYGFRVEGPWDPARGRLFDPTKLLLDPYAKAIDQTFTPHPVVSICTDDGRPNPGDSAPYTPRSVVVADEPFDWGDDHRLGVSWQRTVIYEAHVRGLTKRHPDVPTHQRGTYAGLGHPSVVAHLRDLGVTAVELLPVHHFVSEPHLSRHGLINYWGYNSVGFFAPHAGYAATGTRGQQVTEFKQMVKSLHAAGIEVLLDVVYNHTAEGGRSGPCLAFRGYGDGSYYRHDEHGRYLDVTGCGNTMRVSEPQTLQLVMDSLRYWVEEMHVDGFRFDLAPAMVRTGSGIDLRAPFLAAVQQDPVLRAVKLVAEPWDATGEGYLVGRFPPGWCEWNDRFRDTVRDFWRGRSGGVGDLAARLSGSGDLYADDGRRPLLPVNFVTAHDGFTLRDLVSYDTKHNRANAEDNADGSNDNRSWNCGIEGETDDRHVSRLRQRQAANLLVTLLLSTGVPMLTAGDELGRTQRGNNNAFCQDNDTSWLSWTHDADWAHLLPLARLVLRLRAEHPVLRQPHLPAGTPSADAAPRRLRWLQPSGVEMDQARWEDPSCTTLGVCLSSAAPAIDGHRAGAGTAFLWWLHAGPGPVDVTLPTELATGYREVLRTDLVSEPDASDAIDVRSNRGSGPESTRLLAPGSVVTLADHTCALYEAVSP